MTTTETTIETTEENVKRIAGFMSGIPGVTVIVCDSPLDGTKGVVVFHGKGDDEKNILLQWRFAKAVECSTNFGNGSSPGEAEQAMLSCLTEPGWEKCDNPKQLLIGFVRHAPVGSLMVSEAVMFSLRVFKAMPDSTRDMCNRWREARM